MCGSIDIGQGSSTVLPQICADALGLPLSLFDQVMGDTDLTADAGKSSASRQTFVAPGLGWVCELITLGRRTTGVPAASSNSRPSVAVTGWPFHSSTVNR